MRYALTMMELRIAEIRNVRHGSEVPIAPGRIAGTMPTDPARAKRLQRIHSVLASAGITMLTNDAGRIEIVSPAWLSMMSGRILDALDPTTDAGRVGHGDTDG